MTSRLRRQLYCRCGTHLAKDNTERQCARCRHASRDKLIAAPEVPAEFWQTDQFRDAFAAQHMGRIARAYRTHPHHYAVYGLSGISQGLLGQWLGLSQPQVSRIENGQPIRNLDTLAYWARVLHIPPDLLWFRLPGEKGRLTVTEPTVSRLAPSAANGALESPVGPQSNVNGHPVLVPLDRDSDASNWETMSRSNRRSVLGYGFAAAAAAVLGAHGAERALHQPAAPPTLSVPAHTSWAKAIDDAVLNPMDAARRATASLDDGGHDLPALRVMVDRAMQVSLSSDYGALEQSLPTLIGCVEAATMQSHGDEPAAHLALSDVYAVAGWTLIKADRPVGAWIAAQRAIRAAEQVGDVLRMAAATRCLAEVHMRATNFEEATRTAFLAAVHLESAPPESRSIAVSLRGAAFLSAAAASARRGDSREAHAALKAATVCAAELGQDRSDLATVFGPTNVAIHRVAIAIELGDAKGALRHVPAVQLDRMPAALTERRARCLIDVARSYAHVREDAAAIDALLQAEAVAPDELRHHRLTHELIPRLLARKSRTSDLRVLAARCNLLNEGSSL